VRLGGGVIVLQGEGGIISSPFVSCCNLARLQDVPGLPLGAICGVGVGVGVGVGPGGG
jgi:hypothetical protein